MLVHYSTSSLRQAQDGAGQASGEVRIPNAPGDGSYKRWLMRTSEVIIPISPALRYAGTPYQLLRTGY